ncbi:MAG: HAMP domain-containing sensor histidine kinase [Negativicutes bacterium]|nr:HAMP domain-containing sensor histidine kinase [Negativicutes bacterium]
MFRKLRFQLTMINLVIITVLFLLLTTGSYFFAERDLVGRSEQMIQRVAADINSGNFREPPLRSGPEPPGSSNFPGPPPGGPLESPGHFPPHLFFVKTTGAGVVNFQSASQPLAANQLSLLVEQTLDKKSNLGTIVFDQNKYLYYKTPLQDQAGTLLVFEDLESRENMLRILVIALAVTGLVCLLLSLLGSLFLASRALVPIQKAWQQQKDFIADASHELRTPLTVIRTNLEIVLQNQDEPVANQNKWLNNIKEESEHMAELLNSLLFLARADSQQQFMDKDPFALDQMASQAAEAFKLIAEAKQVSFNVVLNDRITVVGDEARIKQVLGLLVDNALRHTSSGGTVSLEILQTAKTATIIVADNGEGIAPEHLDKIFDRFYQVDQSRFKGGAGLGLAIAKWIVESHGGRIQVASVPGAGTKFTIELPLPQIKD